MGEAGRRGPGIPGAYGLRLKGVGMSDLVIQDPPPWPLATIRQRRQERAARPAVVTPQRVDVPLIDGGSLVVTRDTMTATFSVLAPLTDDDLLHPYLAAAAAWFSHWLGRETFHAGAFVVDGTAYAVAGPKEAGKSSLLAWLSGQGVDVLADDLLVIEGDVVFTGPRCIDLRHGTVASLVDALPASRVRSGTRHRVVLPQTRAEWSFGGWILLEWGPETVMRPVAARDRLARLAPHRVLRVPPTSAGGLLRLATRPMWQLTRERGWDAMDRIIDLVSATVAGRREPE